MAPALGGPPKLLIPREGGVVLLPGPWSPDGHSMHSTARIRCTPCHLKERTDSPGAGRGHALVRLVTRRPLDRARARQPAISDSDLRSFFGNHRSSAIWLVPSRPGGGMPSASRTIAPFTRARCGYRTPANSCFSRTQTAGSMFITSPSTGPVPPKAPERLTTPLNAHAMVSMPEGASSRTRCSRSAPTFRPCLFPIGPP